MGLTMPHYLPLADTDAIHRAVVDAIAANPRMQWINAICAAVAAADPWTCPESRLLGLQIGRAHV